MASNTPTPAYADLEGLSPATIAQLEKLLNRHNDSLSIAFYPISTFVYLTILYINAKFLEYLFTHFSPIYRKMTHANQRTSVMYILNIVHTTAVLVLQLIAAPSLAREYTVKRTDLIRIAAMIVSVLYLFEIIYRASMRTQMLIHHFATLFAICFVAGTLDASGHPSLIVTALVWLFQASTEQFTFVALFMYRFQYPVKHVARLLKFSAIQNLIPKFGFAIYLMIWWGFHQMRNNNTTLDIAYSVIFFLCLFTLIPTQVYGSWVLWKVANGMMKRRNSNQVEAANQEKDRATSFGDEAGEEDLDEMESLAEQLRRQHGETQSRPWDLSARSSYTLQGSVTTTGKEV